MDEFQKIYAVKLDKFDSETTDDQLETERNCTNLMRGYVGRSEQDIFLHKNSHIEFLKSHLYKLSEKWTSMDASRTWFVYWITHSLHLLDSLDRDGLKESVISFLKHCEHPNGGYGGGPKQIPHLAASYAAICALGTIGGKECYDSIDREKLYNFLFKMKNANGGFNMHDDGECDMRSTYCAIAIASMCGIITEELITGVGDYIQSCQNWEGGISGECGLEAHGGFAFCGIAASAIINEHNKLDLPALLRWTVGKQMGCEGGFQGRTNKLVDACYSFWCASIFPILWLLANDNNNNNVPNDLSSMMLSLTPPPSTHMWFNAEKLQMYLLLCCQDRNGGIRDKPGKRPDCYHCCYGLSGLSISQNLTEYHSISDSCIYGNENQNRLNYTHCLYNISPSHLHSMQQYFSQINNQTNATHRSIGAGASRNIWKYTPQ